MFINHDQFVAPLDHAKYITVSSFLFFIPSIYAFIKEEYLISGSLFAAGLMSINHWRHPTYSWRRIADHIAAKFAFIVCFVKGVLFASNPILLTSQIICFGLFLYFYYMSNKYCNCNININNMDSCWWKYHVSFHLFSVCTQILVIFSI